ncbi:MAG: hypothetical protein J5548_12000 [Prevotella sp.]|nr:hypothetical protein [Prevotella sp.]
MYKIQANHSGTRSISVNEEHLSTIEKYHLLDHLVDSNGIIDESVLDKLKFNIRSMLAGDAGSDRALLDLCLDVIYHSNMKALGLQHLITLYEKWESERPANNDDETASSEEQLPE